MTKLFRSVLLLVCLLLTCSCASTNKAGIREEFDRSYKSYNRMLRWDEVAAAGIMYIEPEGREAYIKFAEDFKKRAVSIAEYRVISADCLADKGTGEVVAEFDYYIMPSPRVKTLTYRQLWTYREIDNSKSWKIKSDLPRFE